jgi:hypothetical protein
LDKLNIPPKQIYDFSPINIEPILNLTFHAQLNGFFLISCLVSVFVVCADVKLFWGLLQVEVTRLGCDLKGPEKREREKRERFKKT